jgi:hypothetical protein
LLLVSSCWLLANFAFYLVSQGIAGSSSASKSTQKPGNDGFGENVQPETSNLQPVTFNPQLFQPITHNSKPITHNFFI